MKYMLVMEGGGSRTYGAIDKEYAAATVDFFKNVSGIKDFITSIKTFKPGKMPLDKLPDEIQEEVRQTLKAFRECSVIYANGKFRVSTGCFLADQYADDFFSAGRYTEDEVYTPEEQRENHKEVFGYYC